MGTINYVNNVQHSTKVKGIAVLFFLRDFTEVSVVFMFPKSLINVTASQHKS